MIYLFNQKIKKRIIVTKFKEHCRFEAELECTGLSVAAVDRIVEVCIVVVGIGVVIILSVYL